MDWDEKEYDDSVKQEFIYKFNILKNKSGTDPVRIELFLKNDPEYNNLFKEVDSIAGHILEIRDYQSSIFLLESKEFLSSFNEYYDFFVRFARRFDFGPPQSADDLAQIEIEHLKGRNGEEVIKHIEKRHGLDLVGVERRRNKIKYIYISHKFAKRHASENNDPFFKNLREAQSSFILGNFRASFALLRSLAEMLLKIHYGGEKNAQLGKLIPDVAWHRRSLPKEFDARKISKINERGNQVLHSHDVSDNGYKYEDEIIGHFEVIYDLIEGVDQKP